MDALMDHQVAVNDTVAHLLRPLIDEELSVAFYDLTTIRAQGLSEQGGDVRRFGMSKEGLIARQFMLGVVQQPMACPSTMRSLLATRSRRAHAAAHAGHLAQALSAHPAPGHRGRPGPAVAGQRPQPCLS